MYYFLETIIVNNHTPKTMKPDPHKQKKSNAYKKQHGISNDKKKVESDKPSGEDKRIQSSAKEKSNRDEKVETAGNERSNSTQINEDDSLRRTFGRRKITSNWEKYEEQEVERDVPLLRGADLQEILKSSAGVNTQYQFKNEDLYLDSNLFPHTSIDSTCLLSVDCECLSASLACVSLLERLGLEESLFEPEQISSFKSEAFTASQRYQESVHRDQISCNPSSDTDSSSSSASTALKDVKPFTDSILSENIQDIYMASSSLELDTSDVEHWSAQTQTTAQPLISQDASRNLACIEQVISCQVDSKESLDKINVVDEDVANNRDILTELQTDEKCSNSENSENISVGLHHKQSAGETIKLPSSIQTLSELEDDLDSLLAI
jgi:hypothetical protein